MTFKLPVIAERRFVSRRNVLEALGAAGGGFLLADFMPPRPAFGAEKDVKRKFIFAYFEGGWDQLLGLDPRDPAMTDPKVQLIDPGYAQLAYGFSSRGVQTAGNLK